MRLGGQCRRARRIWARFGNAAHRLRLEQEGPALFHLQLSKASPKATSVRYSTANGTATAGSDYVAKTNQLVTFPAGTTSKNVTIAVKGDTTAEPNEAFSVKLSSPIRMKIGDGTGVGTIQNDD
jgi:Calx-beta domain-containing protein